MSLICPGLLGTVIAISSLSPIAHAAEGLVFTNTVAVVMGERDTRDYVSWVAHERARVEALESMGMRIETGVEMFDESTDISGNIRERSTFKRIT